MSGPKHLWSGDWQRESEAASEDLAYRRAEPPTQKQEPEQTPPGRPRRSRALPIVLAAFVFLAAAALGLTALLGSGGGKPASSTEGQASAPTQQPATPTPQPTPAPQATNPTNPTVPAPQPTTPTGQPPAGTPTTPTTPLSAPTPPVRWLGMEIETLPPGAAVIETVAIGSQADVAGLNPGDVIVAVNNRPITTAGDIARAIQGLPPGDQIPLQISHGSALEQIDLTLGAPPITHP